MDHMEKKMLLFVIGLNGEMCFYNIGMLNLVL